MPEKGIVIGKDGTIYPASCVPGVRRFYERKPKEAAKVKYLVCWPRTSEKPGQVHLTVTAAPADPERQASLKREAGIFKVSGVVTNQRSKHNCVVVRIGRNQTVPKGRRRESQFRNHLLFLSGRAAPFVHYLNKHTVFSCFLKGRQLFINGIENTQEQTTVWIEAGGMKFPWPFQPSTQDIGRLAKANADGKGPFLVPADARERLEARLQQLDLLVAQRADLPGDADHDTTVRIAKIRQRIDKVIRRLGDGDLEQLLETTGLLSALGKLNLEASPSNPNPEPSMSVATAMPSVVLPKNLQKVADQVVAGAPDALIAMSPGMNLKLVKSSIAALMSTEGWWDSLSPEERVKAQKGSYQIRKALKKLDKG